MFTGCAHLGPKTVAVDRFDYSTAIADSWKQQTLLNIVKLRYMDLPVFVDVSSVVAGYSMQSGVSINGTLSTKNAIQGNYVAGGGQAIFTDRPTITYTPMTGQKFLRGLMTPIEPKNIFFMLQSGYAADFILGLTVESLNGAHNRSATAGTVREADPGFVRLLQLLHEVQAADAVGMRVEENKDKTETTVMFFRRDNLTPEIADKLVEIRRLLKLPEGQQQFNLVYSPVGGGDGELARGQPLHVADHGRHGFLRGCAGIGFEGWARDTVGADHRQRGQPRPGRDQVQQGEAGGRLCRRALPKSLVLGGRS